MVPPFLRERKHRSVLVIGLDNAGKTSILCQLANVAEANRAVVKSVRTAPTVGAQMVEFRRRNVRWAAWDMSGQGRYRGLWAAHASRVHAVMFVVDVTDRERIAVARDELHGVLQSRAFRQGHIPVAILANKHDAAADRVPTSGSAGGGGTADGCCCCLSLENVRVALGVDAIQVRRPTRVFATSASSGEGIDHAMDWLTTEAK